MLLQLQQLPMLCKHEPTRRDTPRPQSPAAAALLAACQLLQLATSLQVSMASVADVLLLFGLAALLQLSA
jgi:hypothetical protein